MKTRWSMDKDDFKALQHDLGLRYCPSENCYRGVAVGSTLIEFCVDDGDDKVVPYMNIYEAGVDSGYGYLRDGTPYDCTDRWLDFRKLALDKTFEDFKDSVEREIELLAAEDAHFNEMIHADMEPLWNGF